MPVPPTTNYTVDGLAVARRGPEGAPRVVLVHGTMDRAGGFVKLLRRLGHLEVVRYDRRGYAGSRPGLHPALDGHVDDLVAVMEDRPAVVVGHSMGGLVALAAAARRPDLVRSVAAFEAPLPWLESWSTSSTQRLADLAEGGEEAAADAAERFLRRMLGASTWDRLPAAMRAERRAEGGALVADMVAARAGVRVDLGALAVPVLAGHGDRSEDRHREAAEALAAGAPDAELQVIAGAAHPAHYTHPDEFAAFVDRAVDRARR
jgi:pimeloyl-ACP methyl ester carboxylesterase